ncbi:uncharacterized protein PFL1_06582 [Pseudozyma flocculosa PF-1]|uniref:Thymidylate kinase n=1 Tax=Pseudozyma flocculosa PF-1 TaxID=1277687 RepID=A0A061H1C8_9BASI|nr:uncharacterized protein PFL1_06582 [Pseudozyma flocculosa PF-1]EPQ25909.1 hypothetical protein PFL1_06582 [Pseudozyma flocculosa PF-1]
MSDRSGGPDTAAGGGVAAASPPRVIQGDLYRNRNLGSALSLRKHDLETTPGSAAAPTTTTAGTFTKLRNLSQLRLFRDDAHPETSPSPTSPRSALPASTSSGQVSNRSTLAELPAAAAAADAGPADGGSKLIKRRSRLLDAFRSKRPQSTFEVVRKPIGQRNNSSNSQLNQPSSVKAPAASSDHDHDDGAASAFAVGPRSELAEAQRTRTVSGASDYPRRSTSGRNSSASIASDFERELATRPAEGQLHTRGAHPPSTTKTRRPGPGLGLPFGARRHSGLGVDSAASNSSRAASPLPSPGVDTSAGTFSLHSFRNVRSASDASKAEGASSVNARRQSLLNGGEEFVTPTEELVLPSPFADDVKSPASNRSSVVLSPPQVKAASPAKAVGVSPFQSQNNNSSISVARFRQAARSRSELGGLGAADDVRASTPRLNLADLQDHGERLQGPNPAFASPPAAMSPSQELAALEAELSQGGRSTPLLKLLREREASRGLFIVVEGLDRAGKSTQVARLADKLGAKEIKFPDRTTAIGQMINSYLAQTSNLDDKAIHLLFSANRWECVQSILTTLAEGQSIVCDRYAFSGIAYSCAKGLSFDWCKAPDVGLPLPDLTVFLDLDAETAAARGGYGEERYEKREFQAKVREAFKLVSSEVKDHGGKWATVNAAGSLDDVTREIHKVVVQSTATIDLRVGEVGRLFIDSRATAAPPPPAAREEPVDWRKRQSIDGLASLGNGSLLRHFRSGSNNASGTMPQPAETKATSPSYADQLAAMRSAAAGTFTGLFGSQADADRSSGLGLEPNPTTSAVAAAAAAKGQGVDSDRVLASYNAAHPGRRMTLVEMIDQIEAGRSPDSAPINLPPPSQPWVAAERPPPRSRTSSHSGVAATQPASGPAPAIEAAVLANAANGERFPSTFALGNRSRRSLNVSDIAQPAATTANNDKNRRRTGSESSDDDAEGEDSDSAPVAKRAAPPQSAAPSRAVPLVSPSPQRATSISQKTSTTLESAISTPATEEDDDSPLGLAAGHGKRINVAAPSAAASIEPSKVTSTSSRGPAAGQQGLARPALDARKSSASPASRPASRPQSTSPAPPPPSSSGMPSSPHLYQPMPGSEAHQLSSQQLAMLAAQQQQQQQMQQMEMQQQYMQRYMAAAASSMHQDPVVMQRMHAQAQAQAHYQYQYQLMLMQQQQHHFFAHGAGSSIYGGSEIGTGPRQQPLAAFMQPGVGMPHSSSMSEYGGGGGGGGGRRSGQLHSRTRSSSSGLNVLHEGGAAQPSAVAGRGASPSSSPQPPMLSMMMAAPPPQASSSSAAAAAPSSPSHAQHSFLMAAPPPFFPYGFSRPGPSGAQSEVGTSTAPRSRRSARSSTAAAAAPGAVGAGAMGPPPVPNGGSRLSNGRVDH